MRKKRICRESGCQKWAQNGGVCIKHGATKIIKQCSKEGCTNQVINRGVCIRHGAKLKRCSSEGCTNQVQKGGVCFKHGAKLKQCSIEGCTNQVQSKGVCIRHGAKHRRRCSSVGCTNQAQVGGVCLRHGAKHKRCSHDGCTNKVQRKGLCKRHGAYKRTSSDEANQEGHETFPPLPPLPAIEAVEQDERDQETARPLIETAVEMGGNNSQLSGELTDATARSVDQRVLQGEAPEQVTETPRHPSDVENDWEGNHDSGTREDLAEDLEESGMESSQPPCDIGEETSSNLPGEMGESVGVGEGLYEDMLMLHTATAEDGAGEILPSLSEVDNSGASSGESGAVGVGRDWQSQVGDGEVHVDSVRDSGRSKRTIEGGNKFSSTKRQRTDGVDTEISFPSNSSQLALKTENANLKAALVEKEQDIRALQTKLSSAEKMSDRKAELEEEMQALKESLDNATKSQSDNDSCLICCREHKVTCPRCSFSMCRNCLVMQHLSTRHEYDTEAGYGVFEQDPTKCPGCKLENAFVLEDEEQNVVDKANQRSGGRRSRVQPEAGDRERADADESIADDDDDDHDDASFEFEPSVDDDSSSDYEPSSEDGSASRVGRP
eukprot:scaffold5246_cov72-Skeletonema_dohrnii-CCMP3373.AAC.3